MVVKLKKDGETAFRLRKAGRQKGRVWMQHGCWAKEDINEDRHHYAVLTSKAEGVVAFNKRRLICCSFCFHLGTDFTQEPRLIRTPTLSKVPTLPKGTPARESPTSTNKCFHLEVTHIVSTYNSL